MSGFVRITVGGCFEPESSKIFADCFARGIHRSIQRLASRCSIRELSLWDVSSLYVQPASQPPLRFNNEQSVFTEQSAAGRSAGPLLPATHPTTIPCENQHSGDTRQMYSRLPPATHPTPPPHAQHWPTAQVCSEIEYHITIFSSQVNALRALQTFVYLCSCM